MSHEAAAPVPPDLKHHELPDFLSRLRAQMAPEDVVLLGVDLVKDRGTVEAAYNDSRGITAAFNLNLLTRINREAGADFDITRFAHRAFYNEVEGRIEMHLASTCDQQVHIDGQCIGFGAGETIHTENSYKYSVEEFQELGMEAGYEAERVWTDPVELFSVHCLRVAG